MNRSDDPFITLAARTLADDLAAPAQAAAAPTPAVGRLQGFDLSERPLVCGLKACPGEALPARSTVPLRHAMVGRELLVVFEDGNPQWPIIVGVIEPPEVAAPAGDTAVLADDERQVISAEREIVLRCGDASITLTRAGKVLIKGRYILSRSSGYNKIKGAAIDIN